MGEKLLVYITWKGGTPSIPMKLMFEKIDMNKVNNKLKRMKEEYGKTGQQQKTFIIETEY